MERNKLFLVVPSWNACHFGLWRWTPFGHYTNRLSHRERGLRPKQGRCALFQFRNSRKESKQSKTTKKLVKSYLDRSSLAHEVQPLIWKITKKIAIFVSDNFNKVKINSVNNTPAAPVSRGRKLQGCR